MTTSTSKSTPSFSTTIENGSLGRDTAARSVQFDLVKGKRSDFTKLFNTEVLPTMRKQAGFKDEVLLIQDDHVLEISMWDSAEALRNYEASAYPEIERKLNPVRQGEPMIETYSHADNPQVSGSNR